MNNDIILIMAKAHLDYMYPRVHNKKQRKSFLAQMIYYIDEYSDNVQYDDYCLPIDDLGAWIGNDEGTNLAVKTMNEIITSVENRFEVY